MNTQVIKQAFQGSHNGTLNFPQQAGLLANAGFESYHVDYVRAEWRYYMPNGESHVERRIDPLPQAAMEFSADALKAAIRGAQTGELNYHQFTERALAAGCVYYITYLQGRQVAYFGRKGERHVELFPNAK